MKIIVFYGIGEVAKRAKMLLIKKQFPPDSVTQLDLKQTSIADLATVMVSPSLFLPSHRLMVVENTPDHLDLKKLPSQDGLTMLFLAMQPTVNSLLLLSARALGAKTEVFEGEKELSAFAYLDCLLERKKGAFGELTKLLAEYGGMYILSMIYYALRRNLLPLPTPTFLKKKVERQRQMYQDDDWEKLYLMTLNMEFKIKTGLITEEMGLNFLTGQIIAGKFEELVD